MKKVDKIMRFDIERKNEEDGRKYTRLIGGMQEGEPIITDLQIGEIMKYKRKAGQVRQHINRHIKHFEVGVDIVDFQDYKHEGAHSKYMQDMLECIGYSKQSITQANNIYAMSYKGVLKYLSSQSIRVGTVKGIQEYFQRADDNLIVLTLSKEQHFYKRLKDVFHGMAQSEQQYNILGYRLDFYCKELNLAVEYDEKHHNTKANLHNDAKRQGRIEQELKCRFIRVEEGYEDLGLNKILKCIFSNAELKTAREIENAFATYRVKTFELCDEKHIFR